MKKDKVRTPLKHFGSSEFEIKIKRLTKLRDEYNKVTDHHNLLLEIFNRIRSETSPVNFPTTEIFSALSDEDWTVIVLKGLVERMDDLQDELQRISEHIELEAR